MLLSLFLFILGASIGSFLNVLIYRLPIKKSILGRSFCPHCKKTLSPKELIPILSFILQRGRCLGCKKPISFQYLLVEILTGLLFVGTFLHLKNFFSPSSNFQIIFFEGLFLFFALIVVSALTSIFFMDLKYMVISEEVVFFALLGSIFYQIIGDLFLSINGFDFKEALLFGTLFYLFFLLIVKASREKAMGAGDPKVALILGIFLAKNSIFALFSAFLIGALFGLLLIFFKKKSLKSQVPFAPFLIFSLFLWFFFSDFFLKLFNQWFQLPI